MVPIVTLYMETASSQSLSAGQVILTSILSNKRTVCYSEPNVYSYQIFTEPRAHVDRITGPGKLTVVEEFYFMES